MYKNRINRTATNLDLQSLIRRADIAFDERPRYVEFVCSVWNEDRFGPDLADPVIIDRCDRPEPSSFLDLDDGGCIGLIELNGSIPLYDPSPQGRARRHKIEATFRRANQARLSDVEPNVCNSTSALPPNQGRGSP